MTKANIPEYEELEQRLIEKDAQFREYFTTTGVIGDQKIKDPKKRESQQKKRRRLYQNTQVLMENYQTIVFRLDQSQINELAELLKKKGYSCILTRARNNITISYWPMNLLMGSLSEASAYHLMCYAPVDLKESFEFVRKVALNGKDEEILKLYYDLEFSLQDIAEGLKITDTQVHEGIVRALRKLRHPKYFDLIRYGMKTTVREMIRIESECGFQDGFHRGVEERWEDVNEETGEMNVPESLLVWLERMPVEDLQLPIRIINCLHRNKVVTVAELVQLKDKEIMAMNGMGKAAIKDIRKKQSAYIKELLIELVTNEITEISTREVVNVLGEPV